MVSTLETDNSQSSRIPKRIDLFLKGNYFYYIPEYPLSNFNHIPGASKSYISNNTIRNYYCNLDYQMIKHQDYENRVIHSMVNLSNFLITSIDQNGIKSPLNFFNKENIHPGNKRLICARYLGMSHIPVLWQSVGPMLNLTRITKLTELYNIYGDDISIQIKKKEPQSTLEVAWHGETKCRDANGYDDWYTVSRLRTAINISEYLLKNGLEVINNTQTFEIKNDIFRTTFLKNASNKIYIKILDESILSEDTDFWQLYYHLDPTIYSKTCETGRIAIINEFANSNTQLYNCKLYKSLKRKKLYFD